MVFGFNCQGNELQSGLQHRQKAKLIVLIRERRMQAECDTCGVSVMQHNLLPSNIDRQIDHIRRRRSRSVHNISNPNLSDP